MVAVEGAVGWPGREFFCCFWFGFLATVAVAVAEVLVVAVVVAVVVTVVVTAGGGGLAVIACTSPLNEDSS